MQRKRLGVNLDHVATLRNTRRTFYPCILEAARVCMEAGADLITVHLREDRRHIQDEDVVNLLKAKFLINLEMAPTAQMLEIACKLRPFAVCLVPEKRHELTTEGGLNVLNESGDLPYYIQQLKVSGSKISVFVEPCQEILQKCNDIKVECVELHTGRYCDASLLQEKQKIFQTIKEAVSFCKAHGMEVHAGHGLTYGTTQELLSISDIIEYNIGHFLVSEAIFLGLYGAVKKMKNIIKRGDTIVV